MLKNFNINFLMLLMIPVISLFSSGLISVLWIFMEMQLLFFVTYLISKNFNINSLLNFILIQLISSVLLLLMFFLKQLFPFFNQFSICFCIILFLKMGMIPFHMWLMKFIVHLNFMDLWILLSLMKIIPFIMFHLVFSENIISLLVMNLFFTSVLIFFFNSFKKIITLSSMVNSCFFFFMLLYNSTMVSVFFLLTYFFFLFMFCNELEKNSQDYIFSGKYLNQSPVIFFFLLTQLGVPFFMGFNLKVLLISHLWEMHMMNLTIFLMFLNFCFFSFFYMKLVFFYFFLNQKMGKIANIFFFTKKNSLQFLLLIFFLPLMYFMCISMGILF